jgi:quercetin dioxygenase-like cupin family protein
MKRERVRDSNHGGKMKLTAKYVGAACLALSAYLALAYVAPVTAQQGISRIPLGTTDFPPGYQTVTGIAQIAAGLCAERHSHYGIESGYLMEGDLLLKIEGRPDQNLKPGDPVQIPQGVPHVACTTRGLKVFTVHIVEKGKPFATPRP